MTFDLDALMALWTSPLPADDDAAAAKFREYYHDPVTVNGSQLTAADLVTRARGVQAMLEDAENVVLDSFEAGDKVAMAFRMRGRQVGPMATSLGPLPPDGQPLDVRVIDLLTLVDGRVSNIWMVADELGMLVSRGAVSWKE
jgi:SnoaL-like polyketide cyclase